MPLIKYYLISTCYDGRREFTKALTPNDGNFQRHYPDEYLIANILLKYQQKRFPAVEQRIHNLVVLTEPWAGSACLSSDRNGGKNTLKINEQIVEQIKLSEKEQKNTLILAPWLYGYHHPGITIDVKNKTAIYLDPFGKAAWYEEAVKLNSTLETMGFTTLTVTTRQQTDGVSCGPILTSSMIKFMDEFMSLDTISVDGFSAPKRNLASDRIYQMYINNTVESDEAKVLVDEIMLADVSLWKYFLEEKNIFGKISQSILDAVILQKQAIISWPGNWESNSKYTKAVQFIADFQSAITEYIFANDEALIFKIIPLVMYSNRLFSSKALVFNETFCFDRRHLLKMQDRVVSRDDVIATKNDADKPHVETPALFIYPASYRQLIAGIPDDLMKAQRILDDYTKSNSCVGRFFTGHWNRHHVAAVHALVLRIAGDGKDSIVSVTDLLSELQKLRLVNSNGSLAKRIAFISEHCQESVLAFEENRPGVI